MTDLEADLVITKAEVEKLKAELSKLKTRIAAEGFSDLETMISKYKTVLLDANELSIETDEEIEMLKAQLAASQRRADAAVEAEYEFAGEMNVYPNDAEPDEDHVASICLVKCKKCGWNMFGDGWWEADYGNYQKSEQIPQHCGHCGAKFIDESGPQEAGEGEE